MIVGRLCQSGGPCQSHLTAAFSGRDSNEGHNLNIQWTQSGKFNLVVDVQQLQMGLHATYYASETLSQPVSSAPVPFFDFSRELGQQPPGSLPSNHTFSVRWRGYFWPHHALLYTVYAGVSSVDDRIRVWVDSSLVVDMWWSLSGTEGRGTVVNLAGVLSEIVVEYKQLAGASGASLRWYNTAITSDDELKGPSLYHQISETKSKTFDLTVVAGPICGATSYIRGSGLTMATAGQESIFTLVPRDLFYNLALTMQVEIFISNDKLNQGSITSIQLPSLEHEVRFVPYLAGTSLLSVSVLEGGGLWATYYNGIQFDEPWSSVWDNNIDHAWRIASPGFGLPADYFSVRWSGFVTPPDEKHFLSMLGANQSKSMTHVSYITSDCISMQLNSSEIYSTCSNNSPSYLNIMSNIKERYSILLEYQAIVGDAGCQLTLSRSDTSWIPFTVPSDMLMGVTTLMGSPSTLQVVAGEPKLSDCMTSGLTIHTAGAISIFLLRCTDSYANKIPYFPAVYHRKRLGLPSRTFLNSAKAGDPSLSVFNLMEYVSGYFGDRIFAVVPGGLWATYYEGTGFHPFDVKLNSVQDTISSNVDFPELSMLGKPGTVRMAAFWNVSTDPMQYVSANVAEVDNRVKLWCDSLLIIDQWSSLSGTRMEAVLLFNNTRKANTSFYSNLHEIRLEYKKYTGIFRFSIKVSPNQQDEHLISSSALLSARPLKNMDSDLFNFDGVSNFVKSADVCGEACFISGLGVSFATVGSPSVFILHAKDEFQNPCESFSHGLAFRQAHNYLGGISHEAIAVGQVRASYVPKIEGEYSTSLCLVQGHGLFATYFSRIDFNNPVSAFKEPFIDFSVESGQQPPGSVGIDVSFSVRWSGFVMAQASQVYTLYAYISGIDERLRLWVDTSLVVDLWQQLPGTKGSGIIAFPYANEFHDLRVEYMQGSGSMGVVLKWESDILDTSTNVIGSRPGDSLDLATIGSYALFSCSYLKIQNYFITVQGNDSFLCNSFTHQFGNVLSIATAGIYASFRITLQGNYSVALNDSTNLALLEISSVEVSSEKAMSKLTYTSSKLQNMSYTLLYSLTRSGEYFFSINAAKSGGLIATYFDNMHFLDSKLHSTRVQLDSNFNFFWTEQYPIFNNGPVSTNDYVSIRWKGYLMPSKSGMYTFLTAVRQSVSGGESCLSCFDATRLRLNTTMVVDSWGHPVSLANGSIFLTEGTIYEIEIHYRHFRGNASFQLLWMSSSIPRTVISKEYFMYTPCQLNKEPFRFVVKSGAMALEKTNFTLHSSMVTAGMYAIMYIWPSDAYGNDCVVPNEFALKVSLDSSTLAGVQFPVNITGLAEPYKYGASFPVFRSGSHTILASGLSSGGLQATYFASDIFLNSSFTRLDTVLDFSFEVGVQSVRSLSLSIPFSIRWAGFLRPSIAGVHTVYAGISGIDERIRVWVDSSLVVDMWRNLSGTEGSGTVNFGTAFGFFNTVIEYRQHSGNSGAKLSWSTSAFLKSPISPKHFFTGPEIIQKFDIVVFSGRPSIKSTATGAGLSAVTSGLFSRFTVVSRDEYGNIATSALFSDYVPHLFNPHPLYDVTYKSIVQGIIAITFSVRCQNCSGPFGILLGGVSHISGSPWILSVTQALSCSSLSTAFGSGLSIATAGVFQNLFIIARDMFLNLKSDLAFTEAPFLATVCEDNLIFSSSLAMQSCSEIWPFDFLSSGTLSTRIRATKSGYYRLNLILPTGLKTH